MNATPTAPESAATAGPDDEAAADAPSHRQLRDLMTLLALPAVWREKDPAGIARDLADALAGLLGLDCVLVRTAEGLFAERWPASSGMAPDVACALAPSLPGAGAVAVWTASDPAGGASCRLARVERRFPDEGFIVVAGARRPGFPTALESHLLQVAIDQAGIAMHAARLLSREHERAAKLRATQAALSASLEETYKFVSLVEESGELIGIASLDGKLVFLNRAGQRLVGLEDPALLARTTMLDYVFPDDADAARTLFAGALANGQETAELRFRRSPGGEAVPVWANVFPLRDRNSRVPIAIATVAHDLTEQKRDLDVRERVLGIVSHDLRNPLSAIKMGAAVLGREPRGSPAATGIISRIAASAKRMDAMIADLLDLSKARFGGGIPLDVAPANAHDVCERIVEELRIGHPGREILLSVAGEATGTWDASRLEQIVSNLASNALQYGPDHCPVTIESSGDDASWTLSVHNLGEPIPAELLPRLFDPFRRGDRADHNRFRGNLGVGLFIVHELVAAHGGTIDVASDLAAGTRFVVRLPRIAAQTLVPASPFRTR